MATKHNPAPRWCCRVGERRLDRAAHVGPTGLVSSRRHLESVHAVLPHTLRREALCCIPGAAGTNSKEGSWVQWLTRIRKVNGTIACQESDGQAQVSGLRRRGTRVIWRKLDCLKPNLQTTQRIRPSERHLIPAPRSATASCRGRRNLRGVERCPARAIKEMSGTPTSRSDVRQGRTRDRLGARAPW